MTTQEVHYTSMEEKRQELSGLGLENIQIDEEEINQKALNWTEWISKWNEKAQLSGVPEFMISILHASNLFKNLGYMSQEYKQLAKVAKKFDKAIKLFNQTATAISSINGEISSLNKQYAQIQLEERNFEQNEAYSLFDFLFTMQIDEYEIGFYCTPKAFKKYAKEKERIRENLQELHEKQWQLEEQQKVHESDLNNSETLINKGKKQINNYVKWTSFWNLIQIGVDYWEFQNKLKELNDGSNTLRKTKNELEMLWKKQIVPCIKAVKQGDYVSPRRICKIESKLEGLKCRCEEYIKINVKLRNSAIGSSIKHTVGTISSLGTLYSTHDKLNWVSKSLLTLTSIGSSYLATKNAKLAIDAHKQKKAWQELKKEIEWVQEQLERVYKKLELEEENNFLNKGVLFDKN